MILLIQLYQLVKNVMISSLVRRKSPRFLAKINEVNVLRNLFTIDGFVFVNNTNLSDCDICEDLLHLSYSGTYKVANNFIGATNRNLEKSGFWQSSVSSSNNEYVSTSEKSPDKKQSINANDILQNLKVRFNTKLIFGNLNINSIAGKFDQLKLMILHKLDIL